MYKKLIHNVPELEQHKYYNESLSGYEIDLTIKDAVHVFQNCEIDNCIIRIKSNSTSTKNILSGNIWNNCIMWPNKELSLSTVEASFIGCQFKGKWSGRIVGEVKKCDFSKANLVNFAFFNNITVGDNIIAGEDTVIIENAGEHRSEINELLTGKSNLAMHIPSNVGLFVFNVNKHKDSEILMKLLPKLSYVKFMSKA